MTQTFLVVGLFMGAMAMLPWLIRRVQQKRAAGSMSPLAHVRVLSAVPVGPQQRVVMVEVGPENARTCLVLGVTTQSVNCLHVIPADMLTPGSSGPAMQVQNPSFSQEMADAVGAAQKAQHA
jgi:flagellar protein FliO/FliZ